MTFREATATAYRETGWSEDEIKEALAFSDRHHPAAIPATNKTIPVGEERRVIDELKMISKLPQETIKKLYERASEKVKKSSALN